METWLRICYTEARCQHDVGILRWSMDAGVGMRQVLVVCQDVRVRRAVSELLEREPDLEVIGGAGDGTRPLHEVPALNPDVVLMDLTLPGMNGLDATRMLKAQMPDLEIILLTTFDMQPYHQAAVASGAAGCVVKSALVQELLPMIRNVLGTDG